MRKRDDPGLFLVFVLIICFLMLGIVPKLYVSSFWFKQRQKAAD